MIRPIARTGVRRESIVNGHICGYRGLALLCRACQRFESRRFTRICREDKKASARGSPHSPNPTAYIREPWAVYRARYIAAAARKRRRSKRLRTWRRLARPAGVRALFGGKIAVKAYGTMRKVARSEKIEKKRISEA